MAIKEICIENFKGIKKKRNIKIKPLTLFIGANSSGKSSCIHALACLSQTVKLPNNTKNLIIDDEYAYVHLGRYIDVIHTKNYKDNILLGINLGVSKYHEIELGDTSDLSKIKPVFHEKSGEVVGEYTFKCTKRTQDVYLEKALFQIGDNKYYARKSTNGYGIYDENDLQLAKSAKLRSGLYIDISDFTEVSIIDRSKNLFSLNTAQSKIKNELFNTYYLGPFRQSPQRTYQTRSASPKEVGAYGESTITMLASEAIQTKLREHSNQIAQWLDIMGLAKKINLSRKSNTDLFDVSLLLQDGSELPLADLGYGLSQVLPVLTQCSYAPTNSTLLFEQPEIHLHSAASRKLVHVFIDTIKRKNTNILIETHSPELVKEIQIELRKGNISIEDVVLYKVARVNGETEIEEIEMDKDLFDTYDKWEKGISC